MARDEIKLTDSYVALVARLNAWLYSLEVGQGAAVVGFIDKAAMDSSLAYDDGVVAYVTNDATAGNNGTWRKSGSSGYGYWAQSNFDRVGLLEQSVGAISQFNFTESGLANNFIKEIHLDTTNYTGPTPLYLSRVARGPDSGYGWIIYIGTTPAYSYADSVGFFGGGGASAMTLTETNASGLVGHAIVDWEAVTYDAYTDTLIAPLNNHAYDYNFSPLLGTLYGDFTLDWVDTDKIKNAAVTLEKMASNSVSTGQIKPYAVTSYELATDSVIAEKIADNAIREEHFANLSITTQKLADNSVVGGKISDGAVGTTKLADYSVTVNKIQNGSVSTEKLSDNAVTTDKIETTLLSKINSASRFAFTDDYAANSFIKEIYIDDSAYSGTKPLYLTRIVTAAEGYGYKWIIYITDTPTYINGNVVLSCSLDDNSSDTGIVELLGANGSGLSGEIVVDWDAVAADALIAFTDVAINAQAYDLKYSPYIAHNSAGSIGTDKLAAEAVTVEKIDPAVLLNMKQQVFLSQRQFNILDVDKLNDGATYFIKPNFKNKQKICNNGSEIYMGSHSPSNSLKFVLFSDVHVGYESWGDYSVLNAAISHLNTLTDLDMMVITGDVIDEGYGGVAQTEQLAIYNDIFGKVNCNVYGLEGNHDREVPQFTKNGVIDFNGVRIINFLASYASIQGAPDYISTGTVSAETLIWLEEQLASEDYEHCIVTCHFSIVTGDVSFEWPILDSFTDSDGTYHETNSRTNVLDLCAKYGVKLYINGHEHDADYSRGLIDWTHTVDSQYSTSMVDVNGGSTTNRFSIVTIVGDQATFDVYATADPSVLVDTFTLSI